MKLSNLIRDPIGYAFFFLRNVRIETNFLLTSPLIRATSYLKGIKIGKKCKFIGMPIIVRHPLSKIHIQNNCVIRSDCYSNLVGINHKSIIATLKKNAVISIGSGSGISGTTIAAAKKIIIKNNVICGGNVLITDYDWHVVNPAQRRKPFAQSKPVVIEENVWLGVNVVVLKGVLIGSNSVISANSLVVNNIPSNVVAGGNPCKILYDLTHLFESKK